MKYFLKIFASIILISNIFSLYAQHFYHIPDHKITMAEDDNVNNFYWSKQKKTVKIHTPDMMISKFITLNEYKMFLFSIKENTADSIYKKLVPNSKFFKEGNFEKYYNDILYENYPVIGISWEDALEYCKWKTLHDNEGDSIKYIYVIPTLTDWYSAYNFLSTAEVENDFSKLLSDMTNTDFYSSSYVFTHDLNPDYRYSDLDSPPIRKKIIIGKSFVFRNSNMESQGQQFFHNEDLPFCGFRIIKKKVYRLSEKINTLKSYQNPILIKWGLEKKIAYNNNDVLFPTFTYHKAKKIKGAKYGELTGVKGSDFRNIKSTGCIKDGKPIGNWYFFNKNGLLNKQKSYDIEESVLEAEESMQSYIIPDAPTIEKYTFINDLISSKKNSSKIVSDTDYAYETNKHQFNGYFIYSYHDFTVAGKYINNMRFGKWCMWDENEKLILVREYNSDHKFKTIYPNYRSHELTSLFKDHPYSLQRNSDGYYDYFVLKENSVVWSKTLWRRLNIEDNPILFKDFDFFDFLTEKHKEGRYNPFEATKENEFYKPITLHETLKKYNLETDELVAYIIKEALVFDIERFNMEKRIIGICPVFKNKTTGKEREVFWVYIPDLRKEAAKIKLTTKYLPDYIKNLDDVFFFNYYNGSIIGESNVFSNRRFSEYLVGKQIEIEAQKLQKTIFDFEFYTWKLFNTNKQNPQK